MLMNFQYASDLHLEYAENKRTLLKKPILPAAEILLLAGDIMPLSDLHLHQDFLNYISDHFKFTYWLPGNHEYFGSDLADWPSSFEEKIRPNILLLNHKVKKQETAGAAVELLFSTLWSNIPLECNEIVLKRMQDFKRIKQNGENFTPLFYNQRHQEACTFLAQNLGHNKDELPVNKEQERPTLKIIITHQVPSFINYPIQHQRDPIKVCFASDLDALILNTAPNYWIYGHHHVPIQAFKIGDTTMCTNQLGYVKHRKLGGFNPKATIALPI